MANSRNGFPTIRYMMMMMIMMMMTMTMTMMMKIELKECSLKLQVICSSGTTKMVYDIPVYCSSGVRYLN